MNHLAWLSGLFLMLVVAVDTFETIVLPRTVSRPLRPSRLYLDFSWSVWSVIARRIPGLRAREGFLSAFGPFTLILLIAIWGLMLVLGFSLLAWGLGLPLHGADGEFGDFVYLSAVTLCTLGYGDVTSSSGMGRAMTAGLGAAGFGFFALVIGYLPVLYQSFSRRESTILLLDSRAGSPPVATVLLTRYAQDPRALRELLSEFEKWAAQLLEAYLSYPILAFYRSQHERQTWLGALTAILDSCLLIRLSTGYDDPEDRSLRRQAEMTYAMSRHLLVDLAFLLDAPPQELDRFDEESRRRVLLVLKGMARDRNANHLLAQLDEERQDYEPYLGALASKLFLALPGWCPDEDSTDNWRSSAWERRGHFSSPS